MPNLSMVEKNLIDRLTCMSSGYVLDFSNQTFAEFFATEVDVDIYDDAYAGLGNSKGKRLRSFLDRGQPRAVAKALTALWIYREDLRENGADLETIPSAREKLSMIIERLGGKTLPPSFDDVTDVSGPAPATTPGLGEVRWQKLLDDFLALSSLAPQPRGYAFEGFLSEVFDAFGLAARGSFRNAGEQIDGSFQLAAHTYLLEARWKDAPTPAADLHAFQGKVEERHGWARGLFISYNGFSTEALNAFTSRSVLLMDGPDLYWALARRVPLDKVIAEKARHVAERKSPFGRVQDLFPP